MFWNWFVPRHPKRARRPLRSQLQIETLEDRTVPATLVGLTTSQHLLTFDSASPTQFTQSPVISGLSTPGEVIRSIDSRPASGVIYGLSSLNLLYTIDPSSAVATQVGTGPAAFAQVGQRVAVDFNPAVDRFRVVTNKDQNFRANPNNGALVDGDGNGGNGVQPDTALAYATGDVNAGADPVITGIAYDRNFQGTTQTTLFGIDVALNALVRIGSVNGTPNSPNGGQVETVAALSMDVGKRVGFEITADGTAFVTLSDSNGVGRLYTIDLTTGALTNLGRVGDGTTFRVMSLTSLPRDEIVFATTTTNRLVSFRASDPNSLLSNRAITGLQGGESIAGIDFRPLTGQLFALTSNNRVLIVNQNSGAATEVGAAISGASFAAGAQAGFDFNPTVDRLRLVNADNDNARYNPVTSTLVQADTDLAYIATDANVGVDPNVVAVAYDRNDNNGATLTTLFGIDSTLNNLVRQGAIDGDGTDVAGGGGPNGGLLTTLGSLGVDPTDLVGFDIIDNGMGGNGAALAVMQLQGETVSKLFQINITPGLNALNQPLGTATLIGTVGTTDLITAMAIAPPTIQFSAPTYTATEGGLMARIAVTRTGGSGSTATVTFNTFDGTATAGADYTAVLNMVVTFNPGETKKFVTIPLASDGVTEQPETVLLQLSGVTGNNAVLGTPSTAILTITD